MSVSFIAELSPVYCCLVWSPFALHSCKFGHQVALHELQIWPQDGITCIAILSKIVLLPPSLFTSWYLYQPEPHPSSLSIRVSWFKVRPTQLEEFQFPGKVFQLQWSLFVLQLCTLHTLRAQNCFKHQRSLKKL